MSDIGNIVFSLTLGLKAIIKYPDPIFSAAGQNIGVSG
jgi:hypothetical protein